MCSHVSRSKDALRKHVSYRHPGAPSPSDSESKRKRSRHASAISYALASQQPIKTEFGNDLTLSPASGPQNLTIQQQLMNHNSAGGFPNKLPTPPSSLGATVPPSAVSVTATSMIPSSSSTSATTSSRMEANDHLKLSLQKDVSSMPNTIAESVKRNE